MNALYLGCTAARHARLGIHAVVNARGGHAALNAPTIEDTEMMRDARKVRDRIERRVRFYQFNSRFFRRNHKRLAHLVSSPED